jgi:hypothetical protein
MSEVEYRQYRVNYLQELAESTDNIRAIRHMQNTGAEEGLGEQFNSMVDARVKQIQSETFQFFSNEIDGYRTPIGALSALSVASEDLSEGCLTREQYDELWEKYYSRTDAI